MAHHPDVILKSQAPQIMTLYTGIAGEGEEGDQVPPGPFSYQQYLSYMLREGSWGDQVVIMAFSMMVGATVTVLNVDGLYPLGFRHNRPLDATDVLLVYNGGTHYVGTGNAFDIFVKSYRFSLKAASCPLRVILSFVKSRSNVCKYFFSQFISDSRASFCFPLKVIQVSLKFTYFSLKIVFCFVKNSSSGWRSIAFGGSSGLSRVSPITTATGRGSGGSAGRPAAFYRSTS
jgi:hypothetical protein